jgi:hypothetical protein
MGGIPCYSHLFWREVMLEFVPALGLEVFAHARPDLQLR